MYFINTELNNNQSVFSSLTNIFGINLTTSKKICKCLGISSNMIVKDLSKNQTRFLLKTIVKLKIKTSYDLKKKLIFERKNLINIKSYRGFRLSNKLPVRGQRTHTNSKTCKKGSILK